MQIKNIVMYILMQFFPVLRKAKQCLANIDFFYQRAEKRKGGGGVYKAIPHRKLLVQNNHCGKKVI